MQNDKAKFKNYDIINCKVKYIKLPEVVNKNFHAANMKSNKNWKIKTKEIFLKYEYKIVVFFGLVLVSVISFEGGLMKGQKWQQSPVIIEKPAISQVLGIENEKKPEIPDVAKKTESSAENKKCPFLGSKNSNKYHPATNCRWADAIKEENRICFESEADAESKGYIKSSCFK